MPGDIYYCFRPASSTSGFLFFRRLYSFRFLHLYHLILDIIIAEKRIKYEQNISIRGVVVKEQTYTQFIQEAIDDFQPSEPILVRELGNRIANAYHMDEKKAYATAVVAVKRLIAAGACPHLRSFAKGVYYVAKKTAFGETGINREKLFELKYLEDGTGYETGAAIMQKLGLTTLMPAQRTFVSNSAQHRAKRDDALGIVIHAPRIPVNQENRFYLQFLDLLNMYDNDL